MTPLMIAQAYLVVCGGVLTIAIVKYIIDGLDAMLS